MDARLSVDPDHRPASRRGPVIATIAAAAVFAGIAVWFRSNVPPDCTDPRTEAMVKDALHGRFRIPATAELARIQTMAGGFLALRFVCEAELEGVDPAALPPGPIPHDVEYTSQWADGRQKITVTIEPLLRWVKVQ
jgi:hypothetical protein